MTSAPITHLFQQLLEAVESEAVRNCPIEEASHILGQSEKATRRLLATHGVEVIPGKGIVVDTWPLAEVRALARRLAVEARAATKQPLTQPKPKAKPRRAGIDVSHLLKSPTES